MPSIKALLVTWGVACITSFLQDCPISYAASLEILQLHMEPVFVARAHWVNEEVSVGVSIMMHDDVIKWKHFPCYWPFVRRIHQSPAKSPHKGQWCGALMFSLICVWINVWVNNREAGDLRSYRAHYDVTVMGKGYLAACRETDQKKTDFSGGWFKYNDNWKAMIWSFDLNLLFVQSKEKQDFSLKWNSCWEGYLCTILKDLWGHEWKKNFFYQLLAVK